MSFPDAVQLLRDVLVVELAPVPISSRVPRPRPARFVQVRRVGGVPQTVQDVARLDVITWAPTEPEAMTIALQAREAVWALAGTVLAGVVCYRVEEFMGLRQDDDEQTGTPRAWFTPELTLRANSAIHRAPTS